MKILKLIVVALFAVTVSMNAQQMTTVTASHITDAGGTPLAKGTMSWLPTDCKGTPIPIHIGGGGNAFPKPVVAIIAAGAITGRVDGGTFQVADSSAANPQHACYDVTILDSVTHTIYGPYHGVQPTGATWSWDDWQPNTVTLPELGTAQVQSDWLESNTSALDYIKNKPTFAAVATSGSYNDLSGKPSIPAGPPYTEAQITNLVSDLALKQPVIPDFTCTSGFVANGWSSAQNKLTCVAGGTGSGTSLPSMSEGSTFITSLKTLQAPAYETTDTINNGAFDLSGGSGGDSTCDTHPAVGHTVGCWRNNELEVSNNGDSYSKVLRSADIAGLANDSNVVHKSGDETVDGVKTFSSSPVVPTPTADSQAATKAYVDTHAGSGGGSVPLFVGWWGTGTFVSAVANQTRLYKFYLPSQITTTVLMVAVNATDNTANLYDFGIYNSSGTRVLDVGATAGSTLFGSTTGLKNLTWSGSGSTLSPGWYYIALTTNCSTSCANFTSNSASSGSFITPLLAGTPTSNNTTTGGQLNATVVPPADSWTSGNMFSFALR